MNQLDLRQRLAVITGGSRGIGYAVVCWLASEDCSFSTGAVFDISAAAPATRPSGRVELDVPMAFARRRAWRKGRK
jgi:NAD(P)-dependent dehydrogenase (short-subunit alcohol dehydrogenase family)